jgi:hypothetical protein
VLDALTPTTLGQILPRCGRENGNTENSEEGVRGCGGSLHLLRFQPSCSATHKSLHATLAGYASLDWWADIRASAFVGAGPQGFVPALTGGTPAGRESYRDRDVQEYVERAVRMTKHCEEGPHP